MSFPHFGVLSLGRRSLNIHKVLKYILFKIFLTSANTKKLALAYPSSKIENVMSPGGKGDTFCLLNMLKKG